MRRAARRPRSRATRARASSGSRRGCSPVAEAIADAAYREDQLRLARVALDLLSQVAHVDVDRARLAVVGATAQPLEQLPQREDPSRAGCEQPQQLELDERELHR